MADEILSHLQQGMTPNRFPKTVLLVSVTITVGYSGCVTRVCHLKHYHPPVICLQALAQTLDDNDLQALRDQFDAMDINKDGTITLDEIRQVGAE